MTKYDHGSTQLRWTCPQQIEPYKACAGQVQSKKCYYLWLIQYNRYQSCRSGPMTKYDHGNYDRRSTQPWWTCLQQIVPYKACAGQVQSKKCYYLWLIQYNRSQSCRSGPMTKYDHRNYDHGSTQPRWRCLQQIVPYKACAGQVQSKECYYLHLIQ